ncbi:nitroreductase [Streptomyces sp. NPDC101225]|uniref:nitroreductase n=1 Tax=Streptomyces sp. NPDC101225 TaxID=3366135 RepID=UPI0037FFE11E
MDTLDTRWSVLDESKASVCDVINQRYSCRAFQPDELPREQIERILGVAQQTPSWCNSQGWKIRVTSREGIERLRTAMLRAAESDEQSADFTPPREYTGPRLERRRAAGFALYQALDITREDRLGRDRQMLENYRFFGAPHVAVLTIHEELGAYALVDVGAYIATFCYVAQAAGAATIVQAAPAMYSDALREVLQIPAEQRIVCTISLGYADKQHPANGFRTGRADLKHVVEWIDS